MRVPIRKGGKFTHLKPDPHITVDKLNELKSKLARLKQKQPFAIAEVKRLAADGDFSENAAYQTAKGHLRGINQRILEVEDHLKRAIIIKPDSKSDRVQLGSKITVEVNGKERKLTILGSSETDPLSGIISNNSPIGSALMNRRVGESITVEMNGKEISYKIISIS